MEELVPLGVAIHEEKTKVVDLRQGENFGFLGFDFRRNVNAVGKGWPYYQPQMVKRTGLLRKLKALVKGHISYPIGSVIDLVNPILRGWANYFRIGHSSQCFGYVKDWVEKKLRRFMMCAKKRKGLGWKGWSRTWLYKQLGLYRGYKVVRV